MELAKLIISNLTGIAAVIALVISLVKSSADTVKYDVNMAEIGQLIDDLCATSKIVNSEKKEGGAV